MAENSHPEQNQQQAVAAEPESKYRAHVPPEIRNVTFAVGVRGYEKKAVEAYVRRVNRVIAELEVTRSPQAAVRHAVERVEEQTKSVLDEARASAERITDTAEAEAAEVVAQAKAKAADLVVAASTEADRLQAESEQQVADAKARAEKIVADAKAQAEQRRHESEEELAKLHAEADARMKELEADTASLWDRRHELLGDIDRMADQLHDAAREAAGRLARVGSDDDASESQETAIVEYPPKKPKPAKTS
jgi:DivIVA domain-containing protein